MVGGFILIYKKIIDMRGFGRKISFMAWDL
jgi:hypothetical protein